MWSGRYVDAALKQAGLAACVPIDGLTTTATVPAAVGQSGDFPDSNGLLGVACSGFLLEKISEITLQGLVLFPLSTLHDAPTPPSPTLSATTITYHFG